MRSAIISSFLAQALISSVWAYPLAEDLDCGEETFTEYASETQPPKSLGPWHTAVPPYPTYSPLSSDDKYLTGVPSPGPTFLPPNGTLTGVPSPNPTSLEPITGVPSPDPISPSNSTPAPQPTPTSSCRPTWGSHGHAPSIGTLRAALIFVDFPDAPANSSIHELYGPIASTPAQIYDSMSYGKLKLELVPVLDQFYRMPANSSSYDYKRNLTTDMHVKYIEDALKAVGPSVSFEGIDVLYILPPKNAPEISFSTSTGNHITALDDSVIKKTITFGQDLYRTWGPKTINHETGHAMGLPDLYPYNSSKVETWVGGFDMMGLIAGQSPDYFAWHKWQLGWIDDAQVDCVLEPGKTTHRISPIEVSSENDARDSSKLIAIPTNSTGYVLAEVRSNLGINKGACGTGVLLYTAVSEFEAGEGPVRVIDSKPESHGCDGENYDGELNDAPLKEGEVFDTGLGVIVRVKAQEWNDFVVEIERK